MDLPAILERRPELCLIDELAHTNAPGVEHAKRYEDVESVLAAGIDVLSTLNVQHLESLNDQVAELSGIRVRETIPDAFLGRADEIVVVDLTPEELLERLRAGKVYPSRTDRRGAQQLLPDREPLGAARGRAAPGCRGGRPAPLRRGGEHRLARGVDGFRGPAGGQRATAGAGRALPRRPAAGSPRLALGAAARRRARPALGAPTGHAERGTGARADRPAPARLAAGRAADRRGVGRRRAGRSPASRAASAAPTS